jgi:peptide/nickel transport system permease protein
VVFICFAIIFLMIVMAVFASWIAPYSPVKISLTDRYSPPAWMSSGTAEHLLGTDGLGRDVASRIVHGSRLSLTIAALCIGLSATLGAIVGVVSGYLGGKVDALAMRIVDLFLSVPPILIAIMLAVVIGPSFLNVMLIMTIALWPRFARQMRGEALVIKEQDFVDLARASGVSPMVIMLRHIVPNVMPSLLVLATLQVGYAMLFEASLSFLGVGIPPPKPSWGMMISEGRNLLDQAWWISLFPGISLLLTVLSLNLVGDWVRDRLDPKLRQL